MSGFDAKRIFQWEMVKISENAVFNPKTAFCQVLFISGCKMHFELNPVMEYNSSLKTVFYSIVGWKQRYAKFKPIFAEKCVLHQIHLWHTTLFWKVCFALLCVRNNVLPSFHHFPLKNGFCIKSTQGIQLFLKKCVLLHCDLKEAFCRIFTTSG